MEKTVEKLLRGGIHTAVLKVKAHVCLHCGERFYSQETVRQFEKIRAKLERQETSGLHPLGKLFELRSLRGKINIITDLNISRKR